MLNTVTILTKPWALYNEIDEYAADWLENLIAAGQIAPGIVDRRSIEDLRADDLRGFRQVHFFAGIGVWSFAIRRAGISDDTALWTGSCPCQPFSAAGKGGGMDDERHLWPAFFHLIRECRPSKIYGEQVASKDGLAWLDVVSADMEGEGYAFGAFDTCSAGFGAPHIRQRLRFAAYDLRSEPLGHTSSSRSFSGAQRGVHRQKEGGRPWHGESERSGPIDRMADTSSFGWLRRRAGEAGYGSEKIQRLERFFNVGGLADSDGHEQWARRGVGTQAGTQAGDDAGRCGSVSGLDNNNNEGLERLGCGPETAIRHGQGSVRPASAAGEPDGMADTNIIDDDGTRCRASPERGFIGGPEKLLAINLAERLADPDDGQLPFPRRRSEGRNGPATVDAELTGTGPTNSFWADADWLFCRDGKWRPVEPGTFPLAHGAAARVGRLRAYGNAVDAEATREFIEAYLEKDTIEFVRVGDDFADVLG